MDSGAVPLIGRKTVEIALLNREERNEPGIGCELVRVPVAARPGGRRTRAGAQEPLAR
jgi:hypothetical protein